MFLGYKLSRQELVSQTTGPTHQSPKSLEEFRIPDKGIVQVLQDKPTDGWDLACSLLTAVVTKHTIQFRTAIQTVLIRYFALLILKIWGVVAYCHYLVK